MPILVNLLITLAGTLLAWLVKLFTKRIAFFLTAVIAVVASFGVMKAALLAIVAGLTRAVPPQVPVILSWVVPDNWSTCLSAFVAAQTAVWVFKWAMNIEIQSALVSGI